MSAYLLDRIAQRPTALQPAQPQHPFRRSSQEM